MAQVAEIQPKRPSFDFDRDLAKFSPKQLEAVKLLDSGRVKYLLYGGAMGGGKSYLLRWVIVRLLMRWFFEKKLTGVPAMLACEDYPALKDRQLSKIDREFPPWLGKYHDDHKVWGKCYILDPAYGGGVICFRNLDDASKYKSAEFAIIGVDELTMDSFQTFSDLRTRHRWPGIDDIECPFIGCTNPGGPGHGWVKQLWIDRSFPAELREPFDYAPYFAYLPAVADDNPHLHPSYWSTLNSLPESMRRAYRHGDWGLFVGQAFQEWREHRHTIKPIPIPAHAPIYMTFDWGFGKPFSVGWWWVDADGRLYRFAEWYGWNQTPDEGLRLTDPQIAQGIKDREEAMGLSGKNIIRLAGPDCWNKKADYKGGGQGPSTAEEFSAKKVYLSKGDPSRVLKKRQFHKRLELPESEKELPMLVVYKTCDQFIRTIPSLVHDKNNVEDVDTTGEDHIYDEACHICMARPLALKEPLSAMNLAQRHIAMVENTVQQEAAFERLATRDQQQDRAFWDQIQQGRDMITHDLDGY